MTQDEISQLPKDRLIALAKLAAETVGGGDYHDRIILEACGEPGDFNPLGNCAHAMIVAARLDMTISFGDSVVLVTEPDGLELRTIDYTATGRIAAMRKAITLLAADSAQYI